MKVVVIGSTGGTGRAVTGTLLARGHQVTALARHADALQPKDGLRIVEGDVMQASTLHALMPNQDAVVVCLGNSQNPFARILGRKRTTPADICATGTAHTIDAMRSHGVDRLVVLSAYGVGDTRDLAPLMYRVFFGLVLREQMADKERMEVLIKASGLSWTLIQPPALTDEPERGVWLASVDGELGGTTISRGDVAAFMVEALEGGTHAGQTVALSGAQA